MTTERVVVVTGITDIHADSRDIIATILANNGLARITAAIRRTSSAEHMHLNRIKIISVRILDIQHTIHGDAVGVFAATIALPAKHHGNNRAVYKVYITRDAAKATDWAGWDGEYVEAGKILTDDNIRRGHREIIS